MWNAVTDVLKKDLAEFVTVVKAETQEVVVSAVAKDHVHEKKTTRNLINPKMLTEDPSNSSEFLAFQKNFDVASKTSEISQLLRDDIELTKVHADLVPDLVPYPVFWERFFWRIQKNSEGQQKFTLGLDDEEEEDLRWDQEDDEVTNSPNQSAHPTGETLPRESAHDLAAENKALLLELHEEREKSRGLEATIARLEEDSQRSRQRVNSQVNSQGRHKTTDTPVEEFEKQLTDLRQRLQAAKDSADLAAATASENEKRLTEELVSLRSKYNTELSLRLAAEQSLAQTQMLAANSSDVKTTAPSTLAEPPSVDSTDCREVCSIPGGTPSSLVSPRTSSPTKEGDGVDAEWDDWS